MAEKEYIDKKPIIHDLVAMKIEYDAIALDGIIKALQDAPAADVVEVVRCKDCKHWDKNEGECSHWYGFRENDFCSYGERKEAAP